MNTFVLAQESQWDVYVLAFAFVLVAVLLVALILLQKNRGSGLSGAFGGVGGHSAFGTKTGDFLTWVTVGLTVVFLGLAITGNFVLDPERSGSSAQASETTSDSSPDGADALPTGDSGTASDETPGN